MLARIVSYIPFGVLTAIELANSFSQYLNNYAQITIPFFLTNIPNFTIGTPKLQKFKYTINDFLGKRESQERCCVYMKFID